jgi:4-amino-4-deoxy-L-arabinose transferase-like glycosyltransferase
MKKTLWLILFLAFFLRFYQISSNPPGLYWDEASIGYNAYSILKTGKDESGEFLPIVFKSFGDYKQPLYFYLTSLSMAIFGLNEFAIRFPSAFFGTLTVLLLYFLTKELFRGSGFGLQYSVFSMIFLAISPWHLQFSRAGFEANLALFFIVLGGLMFLKNRFLPMALSFFLAMLTYSAVKLFLFPLIFGLAFFYRKELLKQKTLNLILVFLILATAILLTFILPKSLARFYMVSALTGEEPARALMIFIKNYLAHFSFDFLFFQGDQMPRHGVGEMGNLYFFEIPLVLVGLWHLLKAETRKTKAFLFSWLLAAPIASSLAQPSPHSIRSLNLLVPLAIISSLGFWALFKMVSQKAKRYLYGFCLLSSLVGFYFFLSYLHLYWVHYPQKHALAWQAGNKEMVQAVMAREKDYERVVISNFFGQPYLYLLIHGKIDPDFYQISKNPKGFGRYLFVADDRMEKTGEETLFVSSYEAEPKGKLLTEIKLKNGDVIYRFWEAE